jgi:hypothetical protein
VRQALLHAPVMSDVYKHYRGENLPDEPFFGNALTETFGIPPENHADFRDIFTENLRDAELIEQHNDKTRVRDISKAPGVATDATADLGKLGKAAGVSPGDSCFVMMPFKGQLGSYYEAIYEPAIRKAGLRPVRADDDMFATGKIMDQIWTGIHGAKVLVAELTGRNPNVFYELGLAHALQKPVVLVSSNQEDVPFDVQHIRVIYYDMSDPFWGEKLIAKIAENVLSAINHPNEAVLTKPRTGGAG